MHHCWSKTNRHQSQTLQFSQTLKIAFNFDCHTWHIDVQHANSQSTQAVKNQLTKMSCEHGTFTKSFFLHAEDRPWIENPKKIIFWPNWRSAHIISKIFHHHILSQNWKALHWSANYKTLILHTTGKNLHACRMFWANLEWSMENAKWHKLKTNVIVAQFLHKIITEQRHDAWLNSWIVQQWNKNIDPHILHKMNQKQIDSVWLN